MFTTYGIHRKGFGHKQSKLPCQDFTLCFEGDKFAIAAVSDGHSDPKCFRSDKGAKFACEIAVDVFKLIVNKYPSYEAIKTLSDDEVMFYKRYFLLQWGLRCQDDLLSNPVSVDELDNAVLRYVKRQADKKPGPSFGGDKKSSEFIKARSEFQQAIWRNSVQTYGATCQAAIVTDTYLIVCQNGLRGMGAIIYFDAETEQWFFNVSDQDEPRTGGTDSLCSSKALERIQTQMFPIGLENPYALIIMSDGVSESYSDDKLYPALDYFIKQLQKDKIDRDAFFAERLDNLSEKSVDEDDVSLAFIVNNLPEYCKTINKAVIKDTVSKQSENKTNKSDLEEFAGLADTESNDDSDGEGEIK